VNGIEKILVILSEQAQELENALWDVYYYRSIDNAFGAVLDTLGALVGQPRNGLDDADYRRYIRARIVANKSNSTVEDLILIARLILNDPAATVVVDQEGAAAVVVRIEDLAVEESLAETLISFLRTSKAAGDRLILQTSTAAPEDWLVLDEGTLDGPYVLIDARE
jgi:hypothetical protein